MSSLVSIIIPSFNAESTIVETLDSICRQTWSELEVMVIDDGSTDRTADVAEAYCDERVRVIRAKDQGACHARNVGIQAARGEYMLFLDADDLVNEVHLEKKLEALAATQDPHAIAYGAWWEFFTQPVAGGAVGFSAGRNFDQPMDWLFASMAEGFYVPPHCWLVPTAVVLAAGPWDERLKQNQDGEFFSRILQAASRIVWVPDSIAYYRGGDASSISHVKGAEYTESLILAANQIRDRMLAFIEGDPYRKPLITGLYLRILYRMDPSDIELKNKIWKRIDELGKPPRSLPIGGRQFKRLTFLFGWKLAFQIKHLLRQ